MKSFESFQRFFLWTDWIQQRKPLVSLAGLCKVTHLPLNALNAIEQKEILTQCLDKKIQRCFFSNEPFSRLNMRSPAFSHVFAISHYCFYIKLGLRCLLLWGEFLTAFLKIAQTAFQKCSSEHWLKCMMKTQQAWSGWFYHFSDGCRWTHAHLSSGIQCHFDNNQNDCFSQLVTHNTLHLPIWSWSISKWLRTVHLPRPPTPISKSLALTWIRLWNDSRAAPPPSPRTVHRRLSMDRGLIQMLCQYVPVSTASTV